MHSYSINLQAVDSELDGIPEGQSHFNTQVRPAALSFPSQGLHYDYVGIYPVDVQRFVDMPRNSPYGPLYAVSGPQAHPDAQRIRNDFVLRTNHTPDAKLVRRDILLNQPCQKSVTVVTHHFGFNTAVPLSYAVAGQAVPDLDVFAKINFDINKDDGSLGIDATVFGDQFPNCEAFIEDGRGTRVFLGASVRIGYPVNWIGRSTLRGVQTRPMFFSDLERKLDTAGNFESFNSGVEFHVWNQRISNLERNGRSHSTSFEQH